MFSLTLSLTLTAKPPLHHFQFPPSTQLLFYSYCDYFYWPYLPPCYKTFRPAPDSADCPLNHSLNGHSHSRGTKLTFNTSCFFSILSCDSDQVSPSHKSKIKTLQGERERKLPCHTSDMKAVCLLPVINTPREEETNIRLSNSTFFSLFLSSLLCFLFCLQFSHVRRWVYSMDVLILHILFTHRGISALTFQAWWAFHVATVAWMLNEPAALNPSVWPHHSAQ